MTDNTNRFQSRLVDKNWDRLIRDLRDLQEQVDALSVKVDSIETQVDDHENRLTTAGL
jgi:peptidoglycan hydrolase CwlO-like protein